MDFGAKACRCKKGLRNEASAADDGVHGDIVRLWECVRDLLEGKTNTDFMGIGLGVREDAIIETFATAEAPACGIEREAGAEESIDFGDRDFRQGGGGFEDIEISTHQLGRWILDMVENQFRARDTRVGPADVRMPSDEA